MKGWMHHLQLFSCPSPPTICCRAIEVSQYILPLVAVPFEETTNAGAFRGYTVALFIVPRLTAPSYLCPLLRALFVTGARGMQKDGKGAGKLFIVRTGARRGNGVASGGAVHFSVIRHADKRAITGPRRPNQSPIIGEIALEEWWWAWVGGPVLCFTASLRWSGERPSHHWIG